MLQKTGAFCFLFSKSIQAAVHGAHITHRSSIHEFQHPRMLDLRWKGKVNFPPHNSFPWTCSSDYTGPRLRREMEWEAPVGTTPVCSLLALFLLALPTYLTYSASPATLPSLAESWSSLDICRKALVQRCMKRAAGRAPTWGARLQGCVRPRGQPRMVVVVGVTLAAAGI